MSKSIIISDQAPAPIGPYSQAVKAGNTLYISGQIPFDQLTGEMINENITEETHQVMKNIEAILSAAGMTFVNVVKCSIFLKDLGQFTTVNDAYAMYFKSEPPARECVEVARLPKDVNVEISCIAVG
ncbi:RidA family protein [Roseivirga pacifica]|uniref:RidA family protein n=1 Tax=Roseivirga pacifica TaxID=1267423 RepID=UPI002094A482|nr:RidA family protein [Roseivirga pacifica]MCO6359714.1 RidA family protein [Roseivirga pacifica]MCO6367084.1 RidA family protein [Roseivirga pacifica]MCO6370384.1 RidA family protein [Roseivirga pacifica]MCO6374741.1 RidA family protein [Roseivirga pacifica]MCO6379999.1 RidA family protein [Roseivirga pacifica]